MFYRISSSHPKRTTHLQGNQQIYQGGGPCGSAFRARSVFELSRPCDQDVKLCQNHRPQKNDEPFFIIFLMVGVN